MTNLTELSQLLVDLGLGKTEASAYVQLLLLSEDGPATGYQVAKALGKNPTTVYNALEELLKRGAVETVAARGRQFRAISPDELTRKLEADYISRIQYTKDRLSQLPKVLGHDEVFRLHSQTQVLQRFGELLDRCGNVALLDLAPEMLGWFLDRIESARDRGVTVVLKLYMEPDEETRHRLEGVVFTTEPDGKFILQVMPGPVLRGVFDCAAQLVTYLPGGFKVEKTGDDVEVPQAFWSGNRFLAYQVHSGLASEIIHTELRAMMNGESDAGELRARQDWLAYKIHGPVDWERFWEETGWGDSDEAKVVREGTPLGKDQCVVCDNSDEYRSVAGLAEELAERKKRGALSR